MLASMHRQVGSGFRRDDRRRLFFACIVTALVLQPAAAWAHAFLDHAFPAVGSTVHGTPSEVRLWFTERLEPTFTMAQVLDTSGKSVAMNKGVVSDSDPTLLAIPVSGLTPGIYRVAWRVASVDGHATHGDFTFTVAPGGTSDRAAGR